MQHTSVTSDKPVFEEGDGQGLVKIHQTRKHTIAEASSDEASNCKRTRKTDVEEDAADCIVVSGPSDNDHYEDMDQDDYPDNIYSSSLSSLDSLYSPIITQAAISEPKVPSPTPQTQGLPNPIPVQSGWVSVNGPQEQKTSHSEATFNQSSVFMEQPVTAVNDSVILRKRTLLPQEKILTVAQILPSINQIPELTNTKPQHASSSHVDGQSDGQSINNALAPANTSPTPQNTQSLRSLQTLNSPTQAIPLSAPKINSLTRLKSLDNLTDHISQKDAQAFETIRFQLNKLTTELSGRDHLPASKRRYKKGGTKVQVPRAVSFLTIAPKDIPESGITNAQIDTTFRQLVQAPYPILAPSTSDDAHLSMNSNDMSVSQIYQPPSLEYTIENRAISALSEAEISKLFIELAKHAMIGLVSDQKHNHPPQPIGVLMWQTLSNFYFWYLDLTGIEVKWALIFVLIDVHWQPQKSFVLPFNSLDHFRALKQYIWNLFWTSTNINQRILPFRITVEAQSTETGGVTDKTSADLERNTNEPQTVFGTLDGKQTVPSDIIPYSAHPT